MSEHNGYEVKVLLEKLSKFAYAAVTISVLVYFLLIVIDVIFGAALYYTTLSAVIGTAGVTNLYLAKAIAIFITVGFYLAFPIALKHYLLFRKKKAVVLYGVIYVAWFVILSGLSSINPDFVFNPIEGTARYNYYKSPSGEIELFPKDIQFHPQLGVKLLVITPEVMSEFARKHPNKLAKMRVNSLESGEDKSPSTDITFCRTFEFSDEKPIFLNRDGQPLKIDRVGGEFNSEKSVSIMVWIKNESKSSPVWLYDTHFNGVFMVDRYGNRFQFQNVELPSKVIDTSSNGSPYNTTYKSLLAPDQSISAVVTFSATSDGQPSQFYWNSNSLPRDLYCGMRKANEVF